MSDDIMIDDETLSAFLDGELPEPEMQKIRTTLASNTELSERLRMLGMADQAVKLLSRAVDHEPLPESVLQLLGGDDRETAPAAHPTTFARFRPMLAPALGFCLLLLAVGLVFVSNREPMNETGAFPAIAEYSAYLDTLPSGETVSLAGARLQNRFSFISTGGEYCRQYQLITDTMASENIACRSGNEWELAAALSSPAIPDDSEFRPAGIQDDLNRLLQDMMQGSALDLETEQALIGSRWQQAPTP